MLYTLVMLVFGACKRLDGETVVEGQLIDKSTGNAVKSKGKVAVYNAGKGYSFLFEKETDDNGKFSFRFEGEGDYVLRGYTRQGYYTNWSDAVELKEGHNNKYLKVKMLAPAWVKFRLVNQPPLDTVPVIHIQNFNTDENGQFSISLYNQSKDTSFVKGVTGNESRTIVWYFYRLSGPETIRREFYFPSLDTTEVVILY